MFSDYTKTNVVILCGGKGTRLGSLTEETPKALLKIGGVPFLFHLLKRFQEEGFQYFILAAHYLSKQFERFAEHYQTIFPNIRVVIEKSPMGTGGALRHVVSFVESETFFALNGDVFITQRLQPLLAYHIEQQSPFTLLAIQADRVGGIVDNKGGLQIGMDDTITSFRGHSRVNERWINGGVYVTNKGQILRWPVGCYDLEKELATLLKPNKPLAFRSEGRLLDIGTPECFQLAKEKYELYSLPSC